MQNVHKRHRILLYQTAFLGDVVLTIPLIKEIRNKFPYAEITVVVLPHAVELMRAIQEVDNVISYDKKGRDSGVINLFRLIRFFRERKFDILICPHRSFRSALIASLSDIPLRVAFRESAMSFVYTDLVARNEKLHEADRNLSLLEKITGSLDASTKKIVLKLDDSSKNRAYELLKNNGVDLSSPFIAVAPGSKWATKRWIPEGFGKVISSLLSDGVRAVILGSEDDKGTVNEVKKYAGSGVIDLCGMTTPLVTAAILSRASGLLSNDNAAVHLSSMVGTPVVEIYGPTVPAFGFYPYKIKYEIVEVKNLKCRPCSPHGPAKCPEGHFLCMKTILPAEVYRAVKSILTADEKKL